MPSTPSSPFLRALRSVVPHTGPGGEVLVSTFAVAASDRHTAASAVYAPIEPLSWVVAITFDVAVKILKERPLGKVVGVKGTLAIGDAPYPVARDEAYDDAKRVLSYIPPLTMAPVSILPLDTELMARFSAKALGPGTLRMIPTGGRYHPPGSEQGGDAGQYRAHACRVEYEDWFSGAIMPTQERG